MNTEYSEGRGSLPAGALVSESPHAALPGENPGSAVPGRVVHCKREAFDVYIGRPSKYGNPWRVMGEATRADALAKFEQYVRDGLKRKPEAAEDIKALYGKTLGCWCAPKACHGDILLKIAAELVNGQATHDGAARG